MRLCVSTSLFVRLAYTNPLYLLLTDCLRLLTRQLGWDKEDIGRVAGLALHQLQLDAPGCVRWLGHYSSGGDPLFLSTLADNGVVLEAREVFNLIYLRANNSAGGDPMSVFISLLGSACDVGLCQPWANECSHTTLLLETFGSELRPADRLRMCRELCVHCPDKRKAGRVASLFVQTMQQGEAAALLATVVCSPEFQDVAGQYVTLSVSVSLCVMCLSESLSSSH